jgi:hypothetical protein
MALDGVVQGRKEMQALKKWSDTYNWDVRITQVHRSGQGGGAAQGIPVLESVRGQCCRYVAGPMRRTPDKKIGRLGELSALRAFPEVRVHRDVSMYIRLVLGVGTKASGAKGLDGGKEIPLLRLAH